MTFVTTWTRSSDKPVTRERTPRQVAQQNWLTTKGMAACAVATMEAAMQKAGIKGALYRTNLQNLRAIRAHVLEKADEQWEAAQKKYPKKIKKRKTPRFVTNNYWENEG